MTYRHVMNTVLVRRYGPTTAGIGDSRRVVTAYRAFSLAEALVRAGFERKRGALVWIERRGQAAFWTKPRVN